MLCLVGDVGGVVKLSISVASFLLRLGGERGGASSRNASSCDWVAKEEGLRVGMFPLVTGWRKRNGLRVGMLPLATGWRKSNGLRVEAHSSFATQSQEETFNLNRICAIKSIRS